MRAIGVDWRAALRLSALRRAPAPARRNEAPRSRWEDPVPREQAPCTRRERLASRLRHRASDRLGRGNRGNEPKESWTRNESLAVPAFDSLPFEPRFNRRRTDNPSANPPVSLPQRLRDVRPESPPGCSKSRETPASRDSTRSTRAQLVATTCVKTRTPERLRPGVSRYPLGRRFSRRPVI